MLNLIKTRIKQGFQAIKDVRGAQLNKLFRGLPVIDNHGECGAACRKCLELCPARAVSLEPIRIDLGKCIFCGDCQLGCPGNKIHFSNFHKLAASAPENLIVDETVTADIYYQRAMEGSEKLKKLFKRSLKLRQVSAGGCNGCEMELNACSNVNFDMQRFGIEFVASPRHADGIVITGPITENMASALEETYQATPDPKIVILVGSCAISGGIFAASGALKRDFLQQHPIDLYVPGCPTHPLTFINGLLDLLDSPSIYQ
ncbi:MAG: NADH:ubiquinone oxidoreductase [Acidobacteria bacterium]|jgi:Ni,Fe-hydrogenase III small subunit/NAD-dependent dihydropyrimidine dehydrogenase PreA subunit|nr:NADH:ubiquinone oxidoreductase [Acidobacteriota bacterium]